MRQVAVSYHSLECLEEHGIARNDIQKLNAAGESESTAERKYLGGPSIPFSTCCHFANFHERLLHDRVGTYKQGNSRRMSIYSVSVIFCRTQMASLLSHSCLVFLRCDFHYCYRVDRLLMQRLANCPMSRESRKPKSASSKTL